MSKEPLEPASIYPLYQALTRKLIPWAEQWQQQRTVVARQSFREIANEELPRGVEVAARTIASSESVTRTVKFYDYSIPTHHFPADGMEVTHLPVIACVIDGTAQLEAGDYVLHCQEGSFVIFPPQVPHPDGMHPHLPEAARDFGSAEIFWLYHWKEGIICHLCHSEGPHHTTALSHEECYVISQQALLCFDIMIEEMAKPKSGDQRVYKSLLLSLLIILRKDFEVGNYIQPGASIVESPLMLAEDPIQRAAHYMQFHLNESLTIDTMARKYFMSRSQFTKRFRATIGVSFLDFLTEQRLAKVKRLLHDTDWSLETICNLSGLKLPNLRVLLRTRTGMSPLEYRRHSREKSMETSTE